MPPRKKAKGKQMRTKEVARRPRGNAAACRERNGLEGGSNDKVGARRRGARNQTPVPAEDGEKKAGFRFQRKRLLDFVLLSVVITLSHANTDQVYFLDDTTRGYTGRAADPPSGAPCPPVESSTHVRDKMPQAQDTRQDSTTGSCTR